LLSPSVRANANNAMIDYYWGVIFSPEHGPRARVRISRVSGKFSAERDESPPDTARKS
jgi:hypothetical protein